MTASIAPRQAAFGDTLNQGYSACAAARAAGYGGDWVRAYARAAQPAIAARAAASRPTPAWGEHPLPPTPDTDLYRPMSHEEWVATFVPKG